MKAVSVNKEVLALISKMPETGFVPKCDNVVVFGDRFFGLVYAGHPSHQFFKESFFEKRVGASVVKINAKLP